MLLLHFWLNQHNTTFRTSRKDGAPILWDWRSQTSLKIGHPPLNNSVRRSLPAVRWFRGGSGGLIVFKNTGNLSQKTFLFLGVLRIVGVFLNRYLGRSWRRHGLVSTAKNPREKSFHSLLRVAGLARFG